MSQNNQIDDEELQLAQRVLELSQFVDKNRNMITDLEEKLSVGNSILQKLEKKLEAFTTQVSTIDEEITQQTQDTEKKLEAFATQVSTIDEKIAQQTQDTEKKLEAFVTQVSTIDEKIAQQTQDTEKKLEAFANQFAETQKQQDERISSQQEQFKLALDETVTGIAENISTLSQNNEAFRLELKNQTETNQSQLDSIIKSIELLGEGLEQLNNKHSTILEEQRQSISQFKQKLKELVSLTKADQKIHFENFSRIIESYNENLRTELALTAHSLKESDTKILDEVSASFMSIKVGNELKQSIADLTSELKTEAQKTRNELVEGLQKNVQEYEITMEEQKKSIQKYERELKLFQDEILAIIDRKVNEKYEVISSLLSQVVTQAEELALLIKTSEIQIPSSPYQADQNISDEESKTEPNSQ